jgi:hypothetical protein
MVTLTGKKKAREGTYVEVEKGIVYSNKTPAFTVKYPKTYIPQPFLSDGEVLRETMRDASCVIQVIDLPEDAKLEDAGKTYVEGLKDSEIGTNVKLISSEPTRAKDGTPARLYTVTWMYQGNLPMTTLAITVYKDKKAITMGTHNWGGAGKKAEVKAIVDSLTFK